MLLVAVQLGHVECQGEHRPELGRRRVVVERGLEGLGADGDFHRVALRFTARLVASGFRTGDGDTLWARSVAARKPGQTAGREKGDSSCVAHGESSRPRRHFKCSVKKDVSLSNGITSTRS